MQTVSTVAAVREALADARRKRSRIGFVPTMGALHEGHLSLIRQARAECAVVVVSIFVNPTQFCEGEDLDHYPRPLDRDLQLCDAERVDLVFTPSETEVYPSGSTTSVRVSGLTERLCGAHRPGHFDGVTTVVAVLFNIVLPDVAYFGQKDYQQFVVIRRMAEDLGLPIEIVGCPTVREPDGLALSSRNAYLTESQREQALSLSSALSWGVAEIESGRRDAAELIEAMKRHIEQAGPCTIDYVEIVDPQTLQPLKRIEAEVRLLAAVRIGDCRLIDNMSAGGPVVSGAGCG